MVKQKFSLLKPVRNQVPSSHTLATLRRRGDEVGGLLALLLFADRGLVPEVDEAIAPGPLQHFAAEWIPALPNSGFVNGRQCEGLRGRDFGELLLGATKRPAPLFSSLCSRLVQPDVRWPIQKTAP